MENLSTSDFIAYQVQTGHSLKKKRKSNEKFVFGWCPKYYYLSETESIGRDVKLDDCFAFKI